MLLAGLGSVRIGKNCGLGLENAALGRRQTEVTATEGSIFKTEVTAARSSDFVITGMTTSRVGLR